MKVYRIPVWDNDSGVTHIATTWQIASDPEFKNIVKEVVDSTKYLDFWAVNFVVPKGKVYYIRAKRKFKEVENNTWIGPKKIVNDEAGLSEIIKPELKIETPYINNVDLDYEKGLTITLVPFKGNVPHIGTTWIIKNTNTGELLYKSINDSKNLTELNIDPKDIDFLNIPYITVTVLFHGKLGIESAPNTEVIELANKYFKINANKDIVPSEMDYEGTVEQTTVRKVNLYKAELFTIDNKKVCEGNVNNNKFVFSSSCLDPMMSYKVVLTLGYDNDDTKTFKVTYTFYTNTVTEKVLFNRNRTYKEILNVLHKDTCLVIDKENEDLKDNGLNTSIQMLTEETYVGIIPMVSKDNKVKAYFFSKNDGYFNYIKPMNGFNQGFSKYIKFELTPDNTLYVDTVEAVKINNDIKEVKVLHMFDFNPYTFELRYLKSIRRDDEFITDHNTNAYGVLNGEFYWAGISADDRTKVVVRKVDKNTKNMVTIYENRLDANDSDNIDNVMFARIPEDRFIIVPQYYNNTKEFFGYVLDLSKNTTYKLFTIPKEVRNKHVNVQTLDNGNVLIERTQLDNGNLYYAIINVEDTKNIVTKYTSPMINKDIELSNTIKLKSGNIIEFGFINNKGTSTLWE